MPAAPIDGVVRHLRRAALGADGADLGDAELLQRFISRRDEAAFAALVRRHGPMVLGVCRRVLRHEADAEDAFQATFLVLVRRAATILPRARVGNWLYGVAHKTALKAKALNGKRRSKEREAAARPPAAAPDEARGHLLEVLDDELARLPDKYRASIVLCDLQGKSYREAARQLGCPQGTLSGRLTRGRVLLARRLARHGLAFSGGPLAALLARDGAAASVSPLLTASTVKAAFAYAAGPATAAGAVSAAVVSLTEGALKMMFLNRLKTTVALLLLAGATAAAAGWLCHARASAPPAAWDDASPPPRADGRTVQGRADAPAARAEPGEVATFAVVAVDGKRKVVALVVAGTKGPVLSLPLKEGAFVVADGQKVGPDRLRPGARVSLRMDRTNRSIEEVRVLGRPREDRVPPVTTGRPRPPSLGEVLRALPRVTPGVPYLYEERRDNIRVVSELIKETIDPPRFFPQVGLARLHHCHWKCTVRWTETVESNCPFPMRVRRPRAEVIYLDRDQLPRTR
jgi:RNA polymerase sigma factor (sigma-70 family)